MAWRSPASLDTRLMLRALVIAACLLLLAVAVTAKADEIACFLRSQILPELNRNAGEAVVARGLLRSGEMIELLTTRDGGTWTLLVTPPSLTGRSCPMTTGFSWLTVTGEWGKPL